MESQLTQTPIKKRRGRKPTSKTYFDDLEMRAVLKKYNETHEQKYIDQLVVGFDKIINGMINTHYRYNPNIYTLENNNGVVTKNYDLAKAECMYNIFKSLHLYDPNQRLFGYMNRVIKNTLTQLSIKKTKVHNNEINFSTICNDDINEDYNCTNEENVDNIHTNQTISNNDSGLIPEESISVINPIPIKKSLTVKSSLYIIYKYVCYLYSCVHYYFLNEDDKLELIKNIKYDINANFTFEDAPILNKEMIYNQLISKLDMTLNNIKTFLEQEYSEEIKNKPDDYIGQVSNRSLGYIRKRFKTSIKKSFNTDYYGGVDEIIKFLEYIVIKKEELD